MGTPHHIKDVKMQKSPSQVCSNFPEKNLLAKLHDLYGKEMGGSLSDLLEKIQSIANQHKHLLESNSVKTWLDEVNKFLRDPLEKKTDLKYLIDVGIHVHTCSLLATAEYLENESANCVTEKGPSSVEMDVQIDCFSLMEESIKEIKKVKLDGREYSALRSMAGYAEKYKQCWIKDFGQELKSRLEEARAVAAWLVTVLKMAHDLCVEQIFFTPSGGEFLEVVDDFRRYTEMMNSLLKGVISSKNNAGLDLILHLQRKVESDSRFLKSTIVMVFKGSKCLSIDRAVAWADLHVEDCNPRKSNFVDDAISEAFLEKMPVLLKKLGPRDSLRALPLQHLECSHIARFIGHSENENAKFLILEHMEEDWSTLDSKKLWFSFAEGINITIQVAKAMRHLHENHKNQSLGGWLHPQTIFFRKKNGYYLVKIADVATYEQDSSPNEDDVSRFTMFWRLFDYQQRPLPKKLHELYNSCSAPDPSQRPSFQNICDQLWIVLEEVLTGSSCNLKLKTPLVLEGPKKSSKLAKQFQDSKAILQDMLVQTISGPKDISVATEHIQSSTSVMANHTPVSTDSGQMFAEAIVQIGSLTIADKGAETDNTVLLDETIEPIGVSSDATADTESGSPKDVEVEKVDPFSEKGGWRIQRMLGSGSFGVVYEIVTSDGAFFAAKEVSLIDQGPSSRQAIVQLEQEIVFLSQYQHENIVKYWGTERRDDKFYIFLELMTQGSLASLYKKGPLFERQLRKYTRQILQGLKYLHDHQIFHRDIKCANILVDASGVVKLADFGMAKQLSLANEVQSCKGSAYWMAPEVINPRKAAGLPADIWSLGCTVLEMFARSPPFGELEWHVAFWKIGSGEVPPLDPDLPDDAKDFLVQCLQPDPSKRPTAAMLLEHPFVNLARTSSQPIPKPVPNDLATIVEETSNDLAGSSSGSSSGSGSSYTKAKSVRTRRSQS